MSTNRTVNLKIIIIGSVDVGKTALLNRYVNNRFRDEYQTTIGVSILTKHVTVDNVAVKLQIWDTGGQERFKALVSTFFKGSDGCVLTFAVTDRDSFYAMEGWRNEILARVPAGQEEFPFIVLGNKIDEEQDREVTSEDAEAWCNARNIPYYEVSAKEGTNVDKAFERITQVALSQTRFPKSVKLFQLIPAWTRASSRGVACYGRLVEAVWGRTEVWRVLWSCCPCCIGADPFSRCCSPVFVVWKTS